MSRLIVKNLPRELKEDRLRSLFADKGEVTDIQLKYTKSGVFRRFAFIGYRTEKEAQRAVGFYDKSFIDSSRIQVEIAKDLGDANLSRPWSKYSEKSSAFQKTQDKTEGKKASKELKKTKNQTSTQDKNEDSKKKTDLKKLEAEPEFQDFVEAHKSRSQKAVWGDNVSLPSKKTTTGSKVTFKDDDEDSSSEDKDSSSEDKDSSDDEEDENMEVGEQDDDEGEDDDEDEESGDDDTKMANQTTLSDMDYLKSMMVKSKKPSTQSKESSGSDESSDESSSDAESSDEEEMDSGKGSEEEETDSPDDETSRTKKSSTVKETSAGSSKGKGQPLMQLVPKGKTVTKGQFVVKMKGIPYKVEEKNIVEFFHPIRPTAIRVPILDNGQSKGIAFAEFSCEADVGEAMKRHKDYMGKRYVELSIDQKKEKTPNSSAKNKAPPWAKQAAELENSGEIIADTGRLFIRNLAYICREEDLESMFSKYGPLTEVNLPIDPLTKKIKGFAFITFMMPEHAVKAFTELDGTTFQGRLLHILPGKEKKSEDETLGKEGSSFKNKKKAKDKAMSSSSHNWNSLFISANAVADAMAERYQTTKGQVLDAESNRSLAVRMALGETQIVAETRQFLLDNGVALDSFSQASDKRSKMVILAKNLPAGTKEEELRDLFGKSGSLGRLVLPPAGVTAIVEFLEPSEARSAFYRLAYTKFQHVPLYLEWAPGNVFGELPKQHDEEEVAETSQSAGDAKKETIATKKEPAADKHPKKSKADEEDEDEEEAEPGCTIFIKNLNFDTVEDTLRKKFSKCGAIRNATVSRKKDPKRPGELLSMGYGFVEFKTQDAAKKAVKTLQHCQLDGHSLEIKLSNRGSLQQTPVSSRKQAKQTKQTSTKIMVRNIPFEASQKEVLELFSTFGEIKAVRLPKKMSGTGKHRGFGFVDFLSKQDAKRAFDALCHSSHLYGRRLVLEWAESEESIEDLRKKTAEHFSESRPTKKFKKSHLLDDLKSGDLGS